MHHPVALRDDLARPEALGAPSGSSVEIHETHLSWVFLTADRAFKVKKPRHFGFVDFRSLRQRQAACEAEVRLNRRLAPHVYLGTQPVRQGVDGRACLGGDGPIVDWAVEMVRLPDDRRTDGLLREGRLSRNDVTTFASTLAVFHARARCDDQTAKYGAVEVISANVEENFAETDESLEQFLTPTQAQALRRWQRNFLWDHGPLFRRRAAQGRVRDGHGDLRLEHVYLFQGEAPVVVDCIEFNDRLRFGDVASDIAFYATELVEQGRADLAEAFLARYARDADDYDLYSLVDFYGSYRAFVRGKVLTLVWRDPTISNSLREKAAEEARKYFLLAWAATRRPLVPPQLVAVTGLLASGKSTVAEILSELLAAPIIEADRTRKALLGVAPEEPLRDAPWTGAYTHELTQQVYDELFRRAKLVLASGRSVILDASFRSKAQRSALRQWAHRMHLSPVLVECQAPEDVCRRRLQERERQGTVSDGRLELFEPFRAQFEPVTEWPEASHLVISTDTSREALRETLGQALTAMAITKGATIRP